MNPRDDEIARDSENQVNKVACSTEKTIEKLTETGMSPAELMLFESELRGKQRTIIFCTKAVF